MSGRRLEDKVYNAVGVVAITIFLVAVWLLVASCVRETLHALSMQPSREYIKLEEISDVR